MTHAPANAWMNRCARAGLLGVLAASLLHGCSGLSAGPDGRPPAPATAPVIEGCVGINEIEDRDGDFQRNRAALSDPTLCLRQDVFDEGEHWVLQIIQNRRDPGRVLWAVPHDNENDAFDSAVYAVRRYGGTVVAVETGGRRLNGRQDPNRNFDIGTGSRCPQQLVPSPIYTERFMRWWTPGAPIIALHTNARGGGISVAQPAPNARPFPAPQALGKVPDHTVVFVASTLPPEANPALRAQVDALNRNRVNVLYELVSEQNSDCSMSNYAALKRIQNYFNVEVVQTDGTGQRQIIDVLMGVMGVAPAAR
jgi:hypothetical protein